MANARGYWLTGRTADAIWASSSRVVGGDAVVAEPPSIRLGATSLLHADASTDSQSVAAMTTVAARLVGTSLTRHADLVMQDVEKVIAALGPQVDTLSAYDSPRRVRHLVLDAYVVASHDRGLL